jgi:SAM-dependent methyltransferase
MTSDVDDPMVAEFDTVAGWTAQVAADLGPEYYIPAACRGSGQPAALDWLLAGLRPGPGNLMIDVGAGVGGPAAYATTRTGIRPVLVESEHGACRAAVRLFGAPVVEADAAVLPFADAVADSAWSLGVLCTAESREAQLAMLGELRRVVRPAGRIGLLVYLAAGPRLDDPPQGNHFPEVSQLSALLGDAHLETVRAGDPSDMPPAAPDWQERVDTVERELQRRFGHTPQLSAATKQSDRIGAMLGSGQLTSRVLILRSAADSS